MYGQLMAGGKQFVHCREVVLLLECPLSEVLLFPSIDPPLYYPSVYSVSSSNIQNQPAASPPTMC